MFHKKNYNALIFCRLCGLRDKILSKAGSNSLQRTVLAAKCPRSTHDFPMQTAAGIQGPKHPADELSAQEAAIEWKNKKITAIEVAENLQGRKP